jgi:biotin operon repressor
MAKDLTTGVRRFLEGVSSPGREEALSILAERPTLEIEGVAPHFETDPGTGLLLVAEGFVVLRATIGHALRAVVTCDAGPGDLLLPPSVEEELRTLGSSSLFVINGDARRQLLRIPSLAERIADQLALRLSQNREATATFALTRHLERVRRKLLQLGRSYGHVVPDGIRIDFPVSHALLAEMIGSSRETVTRAVDELQRAGFVARTGSTYRLLLSPDSLSEPFRGDRPPSRSL